MYVKFSGTHGGEFLWKFSRKFVRMCLSVHFVGNYLVHGVWHVADSYISHFSKYYQYQSSQRTSVKMTDFLPSRPEPSICPSTCQPGNVRRTKNLYPFGTQFQPEFKINCRCVLFLYLSFWFYCWLKYTWEYYIRHPSDQCDYQATRRQYLNNHLKVMYAVGCSFL